MKRPVASSLLLAIAILPLALLDSHPDDPKIRDRVAPYRGPGFRSAEAPSALLSGGGGVFSQPFPAQGIELMSWLPLGDFGLQHRNGNDCWGYTSPSGREYAIMGLSHGTGFVEITNPSNAQIIAMIPGTSSLWRDIKTFEHYAYVVSEGGSGIQVLDLGQIDLGTVSLINTVMTGGHASSHNVAIDVDSGYLYRCGGSSNNGLRIYSLADPTSPTYVRNWNTRYVHDAQIVTYQSGPYAGREIAYACSGYNGGRDQTGLDVIDVTNKNSIQVLKRIQYPVAGYSHQCWLSEDRQTLFLDDELDEGNGLNTTTHVFDVSDPGNPVYTGRFWSDSPAIGHNLYARGDRLYEANYRSGLRIFDVSSPVNGFEVASFDTWPEDDAKQFNGLWSTYPFFPSGTVIGSDMEKGLFVWWVGAPKIDFELVDGAPETIAPAGETIEVRLVEEAVGDYAAGTAQIHIDAGSGYVSSALVPIGGDLFQATFPPTTCGQALGFYFTAQSTDGIAWASPNGGRLDPTLTTSGAQRIPGFVDAFEVESGWTVGAPDDTAVEGLWVRKKPIGNAATPYSDRSAIGEFAWITGQLPLGNPIPEHEDVDGGKTTLTSPTYDLTSYTEPVLGYWRWFSNDVGNAPSEDVLTVEISNDGGQGWTSVENVGPVGAGTSGGWYRFQVRVRDMIAPTSDVRVRFVASDTGADSVVESVIDDFEIFDIVCEPLRLDGVTPGVGGYSGGETVTLTGVSFADDLSVFFGGVESTDVIVLDGQTAQVVVPRYPAPGPVGGGSPAGLPSTTVDVRVVSAAGDSTLANGYRYRSRR